MHMIRIKTIVEGKIVRTLFNPQFNNWITIWESQSLDSNSLSQAAKLHLKICTDLKKESTNDQQRIPQEDHNESAQRLEDREESSQKAQASPEIGGDKIKAEGQAAEATSSF